MQDAVFSILDAAVLPKNQIFADGTKIPTGYFCIYES